MNIYKWINSGRHPFFDKHSVQNKLTTSTSELQRYHWHAKLGERAYTAKVSRWRWRLSPEIMFLYLRPPETITFSWVSWAGCSVTLLVNGIEFYPHRVNRKIRSSFSQHTLFFCLADPIFHFLREMNKVLEIKYPRLKVIIVYDTSDIMANVIKGAELATQL